VSTVGPSPAAAQASAAAAEAAAAEAAAAEAAAAEAAAAALAVDEDAAADVEVLEREYEESDSDDEEEEEETEEERATREAVDAAAAFERSGIPVSAAQRKGKREPLPFTLKLPAQQPPSDIEVSEDGPIFTARGTMIFAGSGTGEGEDMPIFTPRTIALQIAAMEELQLQAQAFDSDGPVVTPRSMAIARRARLTHPPAHRIHPPAHRTHPPAHRTQSQVHAPSADTV
jgi:hypothetical protein